MKLVRLSVAVAMLHCCSQSENVAENDSAPTVAFETQAPAGPPSNQIGEHPATQPEGSPLTAAYCFKVEKEQSNPFDNTKACLMMACDAGDKASCDWAATYNGNLNQE